MSPNTIVILENVSLNNEKDLVIKLKRGNTYAFSKLFNKYSSKLYHFGYGYLKSKEEAEELVQDVFMKIWEKHETLNEEQSLGGYLFTIAFNYIKKYFRSKALSNKHLELMVVPLSDQQAYNEAEYLILQQRINHCVEKMPEKRQLVFRKSRMEGKDAETIAKEMHLSKSTVENHLNLALRHLRENLSRS